MIGLLRAQAVGKTRGIPEFVLLSSRSGREGDATMVTQIYAVPDENGVISVACGQDVIEIHVQTASIGKPLPKTIPVESDDSPPPLSGMWIRGSMKGIDIPFRTLKIK